MKCPYCASTVADGVYVCPVCTRDLYLFKPLLAQIEILEEKLRGLEASLATSATVTPRPLVVEEPAAGGAGKAETLSLWLSPLILLLAAHALITVVYDLNTLWLRIVSLLIPLPFALTLVVRQRVYRFGVWSIVALGVAIAAVLGMSSITHLVDQTPVLPQNRLEWKEFIEYTASITFSFMAGFASGWMFWGRLRADQAGLSQGVTLKLAKLITNTHDGAEKLQEAVTKINDIRGSLTTAATAAAALYTGLQSFVGNH